MRKWGLQGGDLCTSPTTIFDGYRKEKIQKKKGANADMPWKVQKERGKTLFFGNQSKGTNRWNNADLWKWQSPKFWIEEKKKRKWRLGRRENRRIGSKKAGDC